MTIKRARTIAQRAHWEMWWGPRDTIRRAFHILHKSAERGNRVDRFWAQVLWDVAGTWE